MMPKYYSFSFA